MERGYRNHVTQRVANARKEIINNYLSGVPVIISDIAKNNNVCESYTYKLLKGIADELGIKREDLLRYPKSFFVRGTCLTPTEKTDIGKIREELQDAISLAESIIAQVDEALAD